MSANTIQDLALATYQKNIEYFKESHPELHKKLLLLDMAIMEGKYIEKYSLEYKDEGYFDVKELATGAYLYGENSEKLAQKAAKSVTYKKNESVIETFYNFDFTEEAAKMVDEEMDPTDSTFATTAPVVQYVNAHISKESQMKYIYKYIFFGTGLGLHIPKIHEKIRASVYFIVENDLELFKLSLFTVDYLDIATKSVLIFSVMESPSVFINSFKRFYHEQFIWNHYLKYFLLSDAYYLKIKEIQSALVTMTHLSYPHDKLLKKNIMVLKNLQEEYQFLRLPDLQKEIFQDKPLLFIAAGPSLDKNINWLKENQDRFVIVAVLMSVYTLKKHDIVPDIVIHVDEGLPVFVKVCENNDVRNYLKNTLFILTASIPMETVLHYVDKERVFLVEDRTSYKVDHGNFEGMSVGEMGYSFCLMTEAKSIYLLGLDLALDQETGHTHAQEHATKNKVDLKSESSDIEQNVSIRSTLLERKGNFRQKVYTTPLFDGSIHILNTHTHKYKKSFQKVYNLNDGAYFEETVPLLTKDIQTRSIGHIDKDSLKQEIHRFFTKISTTCLTEEEKRLFELRYTDVEKKIEAVNRFMELKSSTPEAFIRRFSEMANMLVKRPNERACELAEIFSIYLLYIGGYVMEVSNTKALRNPKRHMKKIQKIVSHQLYKLIENYSEALKRVK